MGLISCSFKCLIKNFFLALYKNNNYYFYTKGSSVSSILILYKNLSMFGPCQLLDIVCLDKFFFEKKKYSLLNFNSRFQLLYILVSFKENKRYVVTTLCSTSAQSISQIFFSAEWLEREIWDFFGIFFVGHPDLRRLLSDYGFQGFPLRKDFPLLGFYELNYDFYLKCLIWSPADLEQKFRFFDFKSAWLN